MGSSPVYSLRIPCSVGLTCLALMGCVAPGEAAVRSGVEGALQMTQFTWKITEMTGVLTPSVHASGPDAESEIGLAAEVPLHGPWTLAGALAYSPLSDSHRFAFSASPWGIATMTTLRMMALPVRIEWHYGGLRVGLGPEVRYLVYASREFDTFGIGDQGPSPNRADVARGGPAAVSTTQDADPGYRKTAAAA